MKCIFLDRVTYRKYLKDAHPKGLHIGAGSHRIPGWLNTDLYPLSPAMVHLDAKGRFPFEDEVFDYIYSEHMIEHIDFSGGLNMLKECYRVLKKDGRIRIVTPDLMFLIGLLTNENDPIAERYVPWAHSYSLPPDTLCTPCAVVNGFVRNWGHQFIYDRKTLGELLALAGFKAISVCDFDHSASPNLSGLANSKRLPEGFVEYESLSVEATK